MIRNTQDGGRERREITRRKFGFTILRAAGAGLVAGQIAHAADPDFTLAVIPDTQYMALQCSAAFTNMMTWIVNNRAASQGGVFDTNIKAVIGVGDCTHNTGAGEFTNSRTAYSRLDHAGIPWVNPPGNHDYVSGAGTERTQIGSGYQNPGGYFGSAMRQAAYGSGIPIPGGGSAGWVDSYDNANYAVRYAIGSRKILVFSIEFLPRAAVLGWAKDLHDSNPDCECIVTTHSFLTDVGEFSTFSGEPGNQIYTNDNGGQGFTTLQATSDENCTSGHGMWTSYLKNWSRLTLVINGHWIYQGWHQNNASANNSWFTQQRPLIGSGRRARTVQGIFANWQEADAGNYSDGVPGGGGNVGPGAYCSLVPQGVDGARIAHVMLLQFRPSAGKLDSYALSTNTGLWEQSYANRTTAPASTPQLLFSADYTDVATNLLPRRPRRPQN